jgi:hypothetical protein
VADAASTAREVLVQRLTTREELANLVRLATTILLGIWVYLAATMDSGAAARGLLPFQSLIEDRPAADQRMFRVLQEGLLEAEIARSVAGAWPDTESLARDGVPPFAPDPTEQSAVYRWQMLRDGTYINYLGIPDRPEAPAWLVLVQEPEPGIPPDQLNEDEEHHRLLDGTMLHVSAWSHANGSTMAARVVRVPQAEGWTQLYAVRPGASRATPPI